MFGIPVRICRRLFADQIYGVVIVAVASLVTSAAAVVVVGVSRPGGYCDARNRTTLVA